MSNKHTTIKFLDAQYKPIENTMATIAIIKHVKPKKQVKQKTNKPKQPSTREILLQFITKVEQFMVEQKQFNAKMERVIILNNLKTE
ncbi:MAG: hypothetical protein LBQ45_02275 [Mycoplasmataceae bacterium]|jgi:hypothetical protein|nr:hypothetical protein [Mycoplasmataceae bacterium]